MADFPISRLQEYPGTGSVPGEALFVARNPTDSKDYRVPADRLPGQGDGTGTSLEQVDLLALTTTQLDAIMALTYTDCDADPAASPAFSRPGMQFDAIDPADNGNYHYYCARGTYVRGNPSTGAGPAWHRVAKV